MRGNLQDAQAAMRERLTGRKKKTEHPGKCRSKFGIVNADSASPVYSSIRNWGLKIKVREPDRSE